MILPIRFGISVLSFSKLSLMAGFDDFPVQNQFAGRSNMPYSSPFSIKTVFVHFQRFLKSILHSLVKALRSATIYLRFKRLEDGVADELAEIVGLSPYYMSKYLAKFLYCWNSTIIRRLNEFCYKSIRFTWIRRNRFPQP